MKRNESIDKLKTWKTVRERCLGEFEGDVDLHRSLRIVENAVKDRDSLTFRPPLPLEYASLDYLTLPIF